MTKQAILLPYAVDQNEPSKPINRIFTIPDNVDERDELLRKLFVEYVLEDVSEEELTITESNTEDNYGDIVVSYDDSVFMFVTYIE